MKATLEGLHKVVTTLKEDITDLQFLVEQEVQLLIHLREISNSITSLTVVDMMMALGNQLERVQVVGRIKL